MPNNDILRRQVGQLLILGYDGLAIDSKLRTTLSTLQPSGVILFARNIEEPRQTWRLLRDSQKTTSVPMFLCIDLEGGTVDRLKKVIAPAPAVKDVFATGERKLFRMHGNILGLESRARLQHRLRSGARPGLCGFAQRADFTHGFRQSEGSGRLCPRIFDRIEGG